MSKQHQYNLSLEWTGNKGAGTSGYSNYERSHIIRKENKPNIELSSDPAFLGDIKKYNPEELLLASISSCHMLWYLHLCAAAGIIVRDYIDNPKGIMEESKNGSGYFSEITLYPEVKITDASMIVAANKLHEKANEMCFIANSVNFTVHHQPKCWA
jgi:organic hydroperoxide reductase OsmC/OhrA